MGMLGQFCDGSFWDLNQTWYSQDPHFTSCFEDVVFISLPAILYCIILGFHLCCVPSYRSILPWTWLNLSKLIFSLSLVFISGALFFKEFYNHNAPYSVLVSSSSKVAIFFIISFLELNNRYNGVTTSKALSTFWLIFSLCSIVLYRSVIQKYFTLCSQPASGIYFILDMVYYPIVFVQLFLSIFVDKKSFNFFQNSNVLDDKSFLAYITYLWFLKFIYKAWKKLLVVSDLSFLSVEITAEHIYATFAKQWKYYLLQEQDKKLSLAWSLIKAFWKYIVGTIILTLLTLLAVLIPPLLLDRIIDFTTDDHYAWRGYFYSILVFVADYSSKVLGNNMVHLQSCSSVQFQAALMGALFRKNLYLSTAARKDYASGTLMNLMSVDVKRIQWFTIQSASLISSPLKIILIVVIMWQYLGPATIAGIGVMAILFPISYYIARIGEKYTDKQMTMKDTRLKHMNEVLNGIKILKLYAWEIPFGAKVSAARKEEIKWIRYSLFCYVFTTFIYFVAPFLVSLVSFATYLLLDSKHFLSPTKAFVSLTLMDQLRSALFELPDSISELVQCNVSLGRLRKFFHAENKIESIVGSNPENDEALTIKEASFSWTADSECMLKGIKLHVPKGKLVAVIGPVGAGKSSLLSALLGEMYKRSGSVDIEGSLAYVPQQTWVLNRSLKHNILLVKHMDEEKYNKIISLCCLRPDLEILPAGDETEIGEKGVNLSGGQKLRVNLAQAVYQDKEVYLLDDPLSAVDVHVRKALFSDVIGNTGLLKNKTRILVTHDISVLHNVDLIVSMKAGHIDEIGTYDELISLNGSFTSFIEEHSNVKNEEESPSKKERIVALANSETYKKNYGDGMKFDDDDDDDLISNGGGDQQLLINAGGDQQLLINDECEVIKKEKTHRLTEDERMEIGGVHRNIYFSYVRQIGVLLFLGASVWYIAYVGFEAGANVWLSKWSSDATSNSTNGTSDTSWRISIYGTFGFAQISAVVCGSLLLVYGSTRASEMYHNDMLKSVLKSPMSFFDSTPTGRILNRFTTDLDTLDVIIFYRMDGWLNCLFRTLASFIVIGFNTPIFLVALVPLAVVYYFIQKLHLNTFRQIKRLESTGRSPIYSLYMESIQGVSSISAYRVQQEFINSFDEKLNRCFVCTHNSYICNRWLTSCLDFLGSSIVLIATLLAIHNRDILSPSIVGLVVTYALSVTDDLKWFVRMSSELEDKSISIERVDEYCHLKPEASWDLTCPGLENNWPGSGNIHFDNYSTKYRENLDLVLKEITLSINASEKVGIIGRTGAGKSSITLALFRIIEAVSGKILIDDIDISKIGLHNLRSKLTIIPQDPLLFTGSLRMNLDPNNEHNDEEIWASLEKSYLKSFVSTLGEGLDYNLEEGGNNLSAGQRQLVCLARALLKNSKILVLDEATASVDMDTDNLIQNTIRTAFAGNTVITIAHRIHTILDYDKIVIMESGNVVEVGNPKTLLEDPNSRFFQMHKESGLI